MSIARGLAAIVRNLMAVLSFRKPVSHDLSEMTAPVHRWHCPSPAWVLPRIGALLPWLAVAAFVLCAIGFYVGFAHVSPNPRRGEVYRIILIHVPATWTALLLYLLMALCAGLARNRHAALAPMVLEAIAPTGALFSFLTLWTGSLWGKPVWGAWWVWDPRLMVDIALVAFFLAIVAVHVGMENAPVADRIVRRIVLTGLAVVALAVSFVPLLPVLHDNPDSAGFESGPGGGIGLAAALVAIAAGFLSYAMAVTMGRLRCVILERERRSAWIQRLRRGRR